MKNIYRIIDANLNRIAEGLRVIEDISRFNFQDAGTTERLRNFRHGVRKKFIHLEDKLILSRNAVDDTGKEISLKTELDKKKDLQHLITANFKRVEEGLRSIEESSKIIGDYKKSKEVEDIRFQIYTLEKEVKGFYKKKLPQGIYGITAEKFSSGRKNIQVVKDMIKGGVKIIQYREKHGVKSFREIYKECMEIRRITRDNGIIFIVNDYIDIAMAVEADGVHLGQDDMPLDQARQLVGSGMIIGLSTHSPDQALWALESEADYIGVGPVFRTYTKEDVCDPVGFEYLEYVVDNVPMPFVAIGGIKEDNIHEIMIRGAKTVALVTEITGADDIAEKVRSLRLLMEKEIYKKDNI